MTRTIPAGEFKAKCLKLIDEVNESGEPLVITKRGKPVARLAPVRRTKKLIGFAEGQVQILGDIISPLDDIEWEAMKE